MLKRPLNTSGCKQQQSAITNRRRGSGYQLSEKRQNTAFFRLRYSLFWLLFIVSCAPKQVVAPSYEGVDINNVLAKLNDTKSIEAVLSIDYEKNDSTMSGDASLNISDESLLLRIYYLGFLAGEVKETNGIIQSKPKLDKNKSVMLVDGLKYSFFWWNIKNYSVDEKEGLFVLKNSYRKLFIDKKTFLPVQQVIELESGEKLNIFYNSPASIEEVSDHPAVTSPSSLPLWYQSNLRIEFRKHIVKVKVKSYEANGEQKGPANDK